MNDKVTIVAGLAVFLVLAAFPFWCGLVPGEDVSLPVREPPEDGSHCIEEDMVSRHMDLLDKWRNDVVRGKDMEEVIEKYTSETYGTLHEKSLTKTCLACHTMKSDGGEKRSCAGCHEYANVEPRCMGCHVERKGD